MRQLRSRRSLPEGWQWVRLGDACKITSGSTPKTANKSFWNGSLVWITPADLGQLRGREIHDSARKITDEGARSCKLSPLPVGAVVMSSGAPIGHLGITAVPMLMGTRCRGLVPNDGLDSEYLYYALKASVSELEALGSGSTFREISRKKMASFEIAIPPMEEQKKIATLLNQAEILHRHYLEVGEKAGELLASLVARLIPTA